MLNLNQKIFFIINNIAGRYAMLDGFFIFVTHYFVPAIIILAVIWFFWILPKNTKGFNSKVAAYKNAFFLVLSLGIVFLIVQIIKTFVAFPRPQEFLNSVHALSYLSGFNSFPSLHTALSFGVATFIYHYHKPTGLILFFIAILVGVSRVFVGVHFPLDVMAGAVIGILVPWLLVWVLRHYDL